MNLSLAVQVLTDYCATLGRYFGAKVGFCNSRVVSYARLAHHAAPEVASFQLSTSFRIRSTSGSSRTALTSSFCLVGVCTTQMRATINGNASGPTYLSHTRAAVNPSVFVVPPGYRCSMHAQGWIPPGGSQHVLSPEQVNALIADASELGALDPRCGPLPAVLDTDFIRTGLHNQLRVGAP